VRPRGLGARRGFTLVEAVATMTVVTILGGVGGSLVYSGVRANRDVAVRSQLHEELCLAVEAVCGVVRGIPARPGPAPDITAVTAASISWAGGGQVWLNGSTLMLTEPGSASIELLRDVSVFEVQCYDASGTALAQSLSGSACDAVQRVQVSVTAVREGVSESVRTRVFIRSLQVGMSP
jgi:hypothetical protein